jgi:hypothetical protein
VQSLPQSNSLLSAAERRTLQGDLLLTLNRALLLLMLELGATICERLGLIPWIAIGPVLDHRLLLNGNPARVMTTRAES